MTFADILAQKRREVSQRQRAHPASALSPALTPSGRSLAAALKAPGARFITEIKKASPSVGRIRATADVVDIANGYAGVADALSVLVDKTFFNGSYDDLRRVAESVGRPVLCKDIVVSPYQIVEARAAGADAVLLMLSVLDDGEYRRCAEIARRYHLDIVTEVHNQSELGRALALGARIIGVNNRDFKTFKTDLSVTRRLAPRVPADRLVICESGIGDHRDAQALAALVDGFLVGTALMKAPDPAVAVRRLVFGTIKVCGLRRPEDARLAYEMGATYGGLIFAAGSPRRIDIEAGVALARAMRLRPVGVFVNQSSGLIADIARRGDLAAVQLHGAEDDIYCRKLRRLLPARCEIWRACRTTGALPRDFPQPADRLLLDNYVADLAGGTGRAFDWSALAAHPLRDRVMLAGGLGPDNAEVASAMGVWGLDVNSGVEQAPGIKEAQLMKRFFESIRLADRAAGPRRAVA